MASIEGGTTFVKQDVTSAAKGSRAAWCDVQGAQQGRPIFGAKIYLPRLTGDYDGTVTKAYMWAIRNLPGSLKSLYILGGYICLSRDTAGATINGGLVASTFSGATLTGGTALTPFVFSTSQALSVGPDIRHGGAAAGLGLNGATVGGRVLSQALSNVANSINHVSFGSALIGLRLQAGEGLLISVDGGIQLGATMGGFLVWGEQ